MKRATAYLALAIVGFIVPPTLITLYVIDYGSLDFGAILDAAFDNKIAIAVFMDITISSIVFWFWAQHEAVLHGLKHWWWVIPANTLIGLCFALPLFLYFRERAIEAGS